jgi:hypothetical protein
VDQLLEEERATGVKCSCSTSEKCLLGFYALYGGIVHLSRRERERWSIRVLEAHERLWCTVLDTFWPTTRSCNETEFEEEIAEI